MKKRIYLIASVILILSLFTGCGNMMSEGSGNYNPAKDNYGELRDFETELEEFSNIIIDISIGNITIEEGETYSLKYRYPEKIQPRSYVKRGSLEINGKNANTKVIDRLDEYFLTITVPSGIELNNIRVNGDMVGVSIQGLSGKILYIEDSMGDTIVSKSKFGTVSVHNSMGDVKLAGNFETLNVESSMGSIEVDDEFEWTGNLHTSMGEITIDGKVEGDTYSRMK